MPTTLDYMGLNAPLGNTGFSQSDLFGMNYPLGNTGFTTGDMVTSGAFGGGGTPSWMSGLGSALGGILPMALSSIFGNDPSKEAMSYLEKIPGTVSPYYQPYIGAGTQGLQGLQDVMSQYTGLTKDPTAVMNKIGSQYTASPGYQWNLGQGLKAANQASAAGGMAGSPAEQAEMAKYAQGLASQDYGDYMNRALGLYGTGLQGMGGTSQFQSQLGYGASNELANTLANVLGSQAKLKYAGQVAQNQSNGGLFGGLGSMVSGLFGGGGGGSGGQGSGGGGFLSAIGSVLPFLL